MKPNMTRRTFVALLCAGACGNATGCASTPRYLVPRQEGPDLRVPISAFGKKTRLVIVSAKVKSPILLTQSQQGYTAVSLTCTHRGCGLQVREDKLKCPCHGSLFTHKGDVLTGPATKALRQYKVVQINHEFLNVEVST